MGYLWPCNVPTWTHWQAVQTQWRHGTSGITGLDYAGVRAYLDEQDLEPPERRDIFAGLQAAESGTLEAVREQAELERKNNP